MLKSLVRNSFEGKVYRGAQDSNRAEIIKDIDKELDRRDLDKSFLTSKEGIVFARDFFMSLAHTKAYQFSLLDLYGQQTSDSKPSLYYPDTQTLRSKLTNSEINDAYILDLFDQAKGDLDQRIEKVADSLMDKKVAEVIFRYTKFYKKDISTPEAKGSEEIIKFNKRQLLKDFVLKTLLISKFKEHESQIIGVYEGDEDFATSIQNFPFIKESYQALENSYKDGKEHQAIEKRFRTQDAVGRLLNTAQRITEVPQENEVEDEAEDNPFAQPSEKKQESQSQIYHIDSPLNGAEFQRLFVDLSRNRGIYSEELKLSLADDLCLTKRGHQGQKSVLEQMVEGAGNRGRELQIRKVTINCSNLSPLAQPPSFENKLEGKDYMLAVVQGKKNTNIDVQQRVGQYVGQHNERKTKFKEDIKAGLVQIIKTFSALRVQQLVINLQSTEYANYSLDREEFEEIFQAAMGEINLEEYTYITKLLVMPYCAKEAKQGDVFEQAINDKVSEAHRKVANTQSAEGETVAFRDIVQEEAKETEGSRGYELLKNPKQAAQAEMVNEVEQEQEQEQQQEQEQEQEKDLTPEVKSEALYQVGVEDEVIEIEKIKDVDDRKEVEKAIDYKSVTKITKLALDRLLKFKKDGLFAGRFDRANMPQGWFFEGNILAYDARYSWSEIPFRMSFDDIASKQFDVPSVNLSGGVDNKILKIVPESKKQDYLPAFKLMFVQKPILAEGFIGKLISLKGAIGNNKFITFRSLVIDPMMKNCQGLEWQSLLEEKAFELFDLFASYSTEEQDLCLKLLKNTRSKGGGKVDSISLLQAFDDFRKNLNQYGIKIEIDKGQEIGITQGDDARMVLHRMDRILHKLLLKEKDGGKYEYQTSKVQEIFKKILEGKYSLARDGLYKAVVEDEIQIFDETIAFEIESLFPEGAKYGDFSIQTGMRRQSHLTRGAALSKSIATKEGFYVDTFHNHVTGVSGVKSGNSLAVPDGKGVPRRSTIRGVDNNSFLSTQAPKPLSSPRHSSVKANKPKAYNEKQLKSFKDIVLLHNAYVHRGQDPEKMEENYQKAVKLLAKLKERGWEQDYLDLVAYFPNLTDLEITNLQDPNNFGIPDLEKLELVKNVLQQTSKKRGQRTTNKLQNFKRLIMQDANKTLSFRDVCNLAKIYSRDTSLNQDDLGKIEGFFTKDPSVRSRFLSNVAHIESFNLKELLNKKVSSLVIYASTLVKGDVDFDENTMKPEDKARVLQFQLDNDIE
ncbi:MAG: hypothetical protein O3B09_03025, partial [Proteobacteria bacterium]|nr:hypothetical protein [Pseudomonadota bacterium]